MPFKHLFTSIMAAAMALTMLSSAPARADNDTAKVIAGAAALAIIGMALKDDNDGYYASRHSYDPYRAQRLRQHNRWVRQQRLRQHQRWVRQQRIQRHQYRQHRRHHGHAHHGHRHNGHRHRGHRNW